MYELKSELDNKKTALKTAIICFISGILMMLFFPLGALVIPFVSALYAALIVVERGSRLFYTYILPPALIVLEIIFCGIYSINSVFAIGLGVLLAYLFLAGKSKAECSVYATLVFILVTIVSSFLYLFYLIGEFSFVGACDFVESLYNDIRAEFIAALAEMATESEAGYSIPVLTDAEINLVFDALSQLLISFVVIFSFALCGVTLKLFSRTLKKSAKSTEYLDTWRFVPSSLIAYFYIALVILNALAGDSTDVLSIAVANLVSMLMPAFFYLGFMLVFALLRQKYNPVPSIAIILVGFLLFGAVALELLSYAGVFFTVVLRKSENGARS